MVKKKEEQKHNEQGRNTVKKPEKNRGDSLIGSLKKKQGEIPNGESAEPRRRHREKRRTNDAFNAKRSASP